MRSVKIFTPVLAALAVALFISTSMAREPGQSWIVKLGKTAISDQVELNGNNWGVQIKNNGQFGYDAAGGDAGGEFPRGTGTFIIFAAGFWVGVWDPVDNKPNVSHIEFGSEYQPGKILNDGVAPDQLEADDDTKSEYKVYVINSDGTGDYADWPVDQGAPVDENGDPLIVSDQDSWSVFNDLNRELHESDNQDVIGLEVWQQTYMFNASGALGDIFFIRYTVNNKSNRDYDSAYVALWFDPDVDDASNDLIGSDTTRGMALTYNSDDHDNPVAFGVDYFQGPIVDAPGETATIPVIGGAGETVTLQDKKVLGMTAMSFYINGTDPDNDVERFNLMAGYTKSGADRSPDQAVGAYDFPGDPVTGEGILDNINDDKRMMLVSGPFPLKAGDSQEIIAACIGGSGGDRLSAIEVVRATDEVAQSTFDNGFITPAAPPPPNLTVEPRDGMAVLTWDNSPEYASDEYGDLVGLDGYTKVDFQGYRVYKSLTGTSGSWRLLAQYDKADGLTTILDSTFVPAAGDYAILPIELGKDVGLQYRFVDTDVTNGQKYFYTVTSYDYQSLEATDRSIEGAIGGNVVEVTPQAPRAGYRFDASVQDTATHTAGGSDGQVLVELVDAANVTGHTYEVRFTTVDGQMYWQLYDTNTGSAVAFDNKYDDPETASFDESMYVVHQAVPDADMSDDNQFFVADGIKVAVFGPPVAPNSVDYEGSDRWISWVNWGGRAFHGAMDYGDHFFGSSFDPTQTPLVEIRFTTDESEWSNCQVYRRDQGYAAVGQGTFPGSAWDMDSSPPRRLNICFVEDDREQTANLKWDPSDAGAGAREYLFIMDSDYNEGVDYDDDNWGPAADVSWAGWLRTRPGHTFLEEESKLVLTPNRVNSTADVYTVETTLNQTKYSEERASADISNVKAVPNPYNGTSLYNLSQFDRRIKFVNLPGTATIKIFTVSGELVRTLEHNDSSDNNRRNTDPFRQGDADPGFTSIEEWDLKTEQGNYVASGFYIAYIDAGDLGTTFVKLIIIQEKEIITGPVGGR